MSNHRKYILKTVGPVILPNIVCLRSSSCAWSRVMKNCEVLVFFAPLFAIPRIPRLIHQYVVWVDAEKNAPVELESRVYLIFERFAIDALASHPCPRGITGLGDEFGHNTVEDDTVVVA